MYIYIGTIHSLKGTKSLLKRAFRKRARRSFREESFWRDIEAPEFYILLADEVTQ